MAKTKFTDREQVDQHIAKLPPHIQPVIQYLRQVMLSIDNEIAEHIKWNSPAFYYSGEIKAFDPKQYKRDILVMNLRKDKIMCVMPTGMNIKTNVDILEGDYADGRRMIYFKDLEDIQQKESKLRATIKEWLSLIEK